MSEKTRLTIEGGFLYSLDNGMVSFTGEDYGIVHKDGLFEKLKEIAEFLIDHDIANVTVINKKYK